MTELFDIPSESSPNKHYMVRHLDDGTWKCGCPDFLMREKKKIVCKHIIKVINKIKKEEEEKNAISKADPPDQEEV